MYPVSEFSQCDNVSKQFDYFLSGVYSEAFNYQTWEIVPGIDPRNKLGIDRVLILHSGTGRVTIEEKLLSVTTTKQYPDICIELEHFKDGKKIPGWIYTTPQSEYFVFAWPKASRAILLKTDEFFNWFAENKLQLISQYRTRIHTDRYSGKMTTVLFIDRTEFLRIYPHKTIAVKNNQKFNLANLGVK